MATRIQRKSRKAKKVMVAGTWSTGTFTPTKVFARMPRLDPKGFPDYAGVPAPVLVDVTVGAVSGPPQPPAGQPNSSWARPQIIAWLQANGVTMTAAALEQMSKAVKFAVEKYIIKIGKNH